MRALSMLLPALLLSACNGTEPSDPAQDSGSQDTGPGDTDPKDTGDTVLDGELFYGLWDLVHVDDTDGADNYPLEVEDEGCWLTTSFELLVNTDLSGSFDQTVSRECPGQDPLVETFSFDMKGAYIIHREFTIRVKDWELALTCVIPDDDVDKVSCAGVDDSGPLVLDFVRAR